MSDKYTMIYIAYVGVKIGRNLGLENIVISPDYATLKLCKDRVKSPVIGQLTPLFPYARYLMEE